MDESEPALLTLRQAAARLNCSVDTVRRRVHSGDLEAIQLGGRGKALRVERDALENWLRSTPDPGEEG